MIREAIKKVENKENDVSKIDPKEKELHQNDNPVLKKD